MSHGQNVTVDVPIGSKYHSRRSELGRNVQAVKITGYELNVTVFEGKLSSNEVIITLFRAN